MRSILYEARLKLLNLHSLDRRRLRVDLREVFKFYMGYNKGNIRKILRICNHDRTRKIEHQVFRLEPENLMFKKETGRNWFSNTVVDDWNGLSNQAVSAEAFGNCKRKLHIYRWG